MPGKDRGLVGVELFHDEVRAVYVRKRGNKAEVAAAAHVRMPEGGLVTGLVALPNIVAVALRRILDEMRVPSGIGAVIGVPSEGITVRTVTVPPVPDEDLATVVAGEVEHYRILRTKGSHAFVALSPPVPAPPGTPRPIVVAAAEDAVTKSLGELATEAGLRLVALEPVEFGLLRSLAAALGTNEAAFAILIGQQTTDLAAFSQGQLWSYRRVEVGLKQLLPGRRDSAPSQPGGIYKPAPEGDPQTQKYVRTTLDSLCAEIGRSIDYLGREYPDHAHFAKLHLSVSDAEAADIVTELAERLAIPVEVVSPCAGTEVAAGVQAKIDGPEGLRYSAAFGLAMRDYVTFSGALPRVDLYAVDRALAASLVVRRNLTGSLVTAAAAIVIGGVGYFLYDRQVSEIEPQIAASKEHTRALNTEAAAATEKHRARDTQIGLLSKDGVPATALMDSLAASLEPSVGIASLAATTGGSVLITADAENELSMLRTVESVQRIPILQNVMVQTFSSKSAQGGPLTFTLAATSLPMSQVRVVPATQPGEATRIDGAVGTTQSLRTGGGTK